MSQELKIQRMEQSDLVQIQRLYEELLAGGISMEVLERQFAAVSNREDYRLFVAKGGGRVWGTVIGIVCQALDAPFLVIENVVVDTAYRNQGVGWKMFAALDEFAKEKGCGYAILVSSGFREGAHRFYEAMGYTEDVRGFRKYYSAE